VSQIGENSKVFPGWWLAAALFVILFNTAGMGFWVFPVFIGSLQQEFGWTMTQISVSAAIFAIIFGISSPIVGMLFARFGARKTMLAAALLATVVDLCYASLQSLWMLYAISLVAGFVVAGTTLVPAQALITNWFDKYRGRAMAVTMLGVGAGGFILPPLNEFLIRLWGWRFTWVFACVVLWAVVIPLIAIFVRTRPSDVGLLPDGATPGEEIDGKTAATMRGLPVKCAVKTQAFWLLIGIYILQLIGLSALNFHFVPFAQQEAGFSSQQAAFFYGLAACFSIAGRLVFGWLADRYKPALLTAVTGVLLACGPAFVWLFIIQAGLRDVDLLWLYSVPYGMGIGAFAVILPILVGRCFGELHFSKLMGLVMSGFAVGIIAGIPVAAKIFDTTGSYEIMFIGCVLAFIISAVLAVMIQPERYQAEFETK
jgi:OFA family oxalate/formate antiporter-like MFS transporter